METKMETRMDLDAIEARCRAATPYPLDVTRYAGGGALVDLAWGGASVATFVRAADADLFVEARTDLPTLVARVRELEAERDALASSLRLLVAEEGQTNHLHDRPGQWDDDGRPCHRCHAFDDARRLLGIDGAMPSYGGNHADE